MKLQSSARRIALGLFALLVSTALHGELPKQGELVETPTSKGVILSPAMVKATKVIKAEWDPTDPLNRKREVSFWTPSRALVVQAEQKIASRLAEVRATVPTHGYHFQEYYTPKHYSRDRVQPIPAAAYDGQLDLFEDWASQMESSNPRQYIGITVDGKKALLILFLLEHDAHWTSAVSSHYYNYLYYEIEDDDFVESEFGVIEDR